MCLYVTAKAPNFTPLNFFTNAGISAKLYLFVWLEIVLPHTMLIENIILTQLVLFVFTLLKLYTVIL